jgi:hypothetical protein
LDRPRNGYLAVKPFHLPKIVSSVHKILGRDPKLLGKYIFHPNFYEKSPQFTEIDPKPNLSQKI